ncbi:NUDIX hydrolase [Microbacterium hibisci]|uniref:NUDIX hydrolase n=1 Tax=Microbacterium hibisci TaxID=2036000 RepID=UPI001EF3A513|nr:NUDIX hydrolase [Microbacterium hibisci]
MPDPAADQVVDVERILAESAHPAWLPSGSRVEIVQRREPPQPMSLVRLLLRLGDDVFCVPRADSGKLDLPTRATAEGPADGSAAIAALSEAVTGSRVRPVFVGAVRNIVPDPPATYPWPAPCAHFGVWSTDEPPVVDGTWVDVGRGDSLLRDRHWFPLVRAV